MVGNLAFVLRIELDIAVNIATCSRLIPSDRDSQGIGGETFVISGNIATSYKEQ